MSNTYRTKSRDVLDKIVLDHYGDVPGALEAVLAANPSIRNQSAVLASGVHINLPDFTPAVDDTRVRLWS
jgi:phage tail protein X